MFDLVIGITVISALSLLTGVGCARWCRNASNRRAAGVVIAAGTANTAFLMSLHGRLVLTQVVPWSNAIVVTNWLPIGLGAIGGAIASRVSIPKWRRGFFLAALAGFGGYALVQPFLVKPPAGNESWTEDGVMLQTTAASCSAAAAATMLRQYDVDATESELMRLCFTGAQGTPSLGLYRGLKLKAEDSSLAVEPFFANADELLEADDWPALLFVHLEPGFDGDPRYEREWGWTPGLRHSVVVFGRAGEERIDVGDPSIGREEWTLTDLRVLWHGEGLRLRTQE